MNKVELISENKNYTAVNVGSMDQLSEHSLIHPVSKRVIEGKVFLKDPTKATGTEISFNTLPPNTELSYFHIHIQNEETYIIIKGKGDFQVDDDCIPVTEGSVIRVAPKGVRSLRNTSSEAMVYIVIQSKEGSLVQHSSADGERLEYKKAW